MIHGALRDPEDNRDIPIKATFRRAPGLPLPRSVDYTSSMGPVRDQGNYGACVAYAATGMKTAQENKDIGLLLSYSPWYIYWQRANDGEGMWIRDAMRILHKHGVCLSAILGDEKAGYRGMIPGAAKKDAQNYRIEAYARIETVDQMRQTLLEQGPFVMSIPVYDSFIATGKDGVVPMPQTDNERFHGGHAVVVIGYDDDRGKFKFQNSWGEKWGNKGYGYFTYEFVQKYFWDAWRAVDAKSIRPHLSHIWWMTFWKKVIKVLKNPITWFTIIILGLATLKFLRML